MIDIYKIISSFKRKDKPVVVTFTGGMGAQVISAAIYFWMRSENKSVFADLKYFETEISIAKEGDIGNASHWGWQLNLFGLQPDMFETNPLLNEKNSTFIFDGVEKVSLGLKALSFLEIRKYFDISAASEVVLPNWDGSSYLCIHIRRGDYLNVASHLVDGDKFLHAAKKFTGLLRHVIVLSDSVIDSELQLELKKIFQKTEFLYELGPDAAHKIMRHAKVLICSNSQFSLIAAALNTNALTFVPSKWFGDDNKEIEKCIQNQCDFQVFDI